MADRFSLTSQQVDFFQTFGFLSLPGLFADSIAAITEQFDRAFINYSANICEKLVETHYMKVRKILPHLLERDTEWAALLDDPRVDGIFSSILGDDYLYHDSQGDIFLGDTYWHSDIYDLFARYQHIKIAWYLDPMDADSGAFRVLPGSHNLGDKYGKGLGMHKIDNLNRFGMTDADMPGVVLPTRPGDVLVFDYRLKHVTCNTRYPRRMLTVFACNNVTDADLAELGRRSIEKLETSGGIYLPSMLEGASASRMRHLQRKLDAIALYQSQSGSGGA